MLTVAVVIAWLAASYRVVISALQPRTLWRSSFTAVALAVAVASTLYGLRVPIDHYLNAPNLADLLSRLVISARAGFLLVYLHALRSETVPAYALVLYATVTIMVLLTLVSAWRFGSFGDRELNELLTRPSTSVTVYCLAGANENFNSLLRQVPSEGHRSVGPR